MRIVLLQIGVSRHLRFCLLFLAMLSVSTSTSAVEEEEDDDDEPSRSSSSPSALNYSLRWRRSARACISASRLRASRPGIWKEAGSGSAKGFTQGWPAPSPDVAS